MRWSRGGCRSGGCGGCLLSGGCLLGLSGGGGCAALGGGCLLGLASGLALAGAFLALAVALFAVFHELFAALEFLGGVFHFAEAVEGGFDDVDGVCAASDFGHNVMDAGEFHDGADGAAGDDAGAGLGGFEHYD